MAGGDDKKLARLQRFNSPLDVWKSYTEIEGKISSGKLKAVPEPLAENATTEQVAAWRKEQGLPETAKSYVDGLQLPQGMIPGEADKPLLQAFAEDAFANGWDAQRYNQAIGWYYKFQDKLLGDRQKIDQDYHVESSRSLMAEWGNEFQPNLTRVQQFFDANFPKEYDDIRAARLPDGRLVGDDPAYNKVFLELAKLINPAAAVLPNIPGATMTNVGDRIAEIEQKHMRAPEGSDAWRAYFKGEAGMRMQQEYRELISARETMRERQGAGR
jgi:hypothetical protein